MYLWLCWYNNSADGYCKAVMDMDCAELEALGAQYLTEEEKEEMEN